MAYFYLNIGKSLGSIKELVDSREDENGKVYPDLKTRLDQKEKEFNLKLTDLEALIKNQNIPDIENPDSDSDDSNSQLKVYGVRIDTTNSNPETALVYTDDAIDFTPAKGNNGSFNYGSWKKVFPFNQIKPCLYKNGEVNYYLNPNDYDKKVDGSVADITSGDDGDVMVEFPKVWWKFETVGNYLDIKYANKQVDSSWKCLAHQKGNSEFDKVYISAYMGYSLSGKLRSLSGKIPTTDETISTFRTQAKANGSNYNQMAYYQLLMLQVLFIIMFKSRDSQTALGRGYVDDNSESTSTGATNTKGLFYGESTGYQQNKFCGIEDFWGNTVYWIDGFFSDSNINILIGNTNFNDNGNGYTNYGQGSDVSGFIDTIKGGTETGFLIETNNGSAKTYYPDYGGLSAGAFPYFGSYYNDGSSGGAFQLYVNYDATASYWFVGARLFAL